MAENGISRAKQIAPVLAREFIRSKIYYIFL